jgi:hypothetical protein
MTIFVETKHAEMKALPVLRSSVRSLFDVGRDTANSADVQFLALMDGEKPKDPVWGW